jgi:flagellar biosynthesis/type III secretory pathway M-ring protein FliF/YscJ
MKPMGKILPVIFIITGVAIVLIGIFEIIMILTGKKTEKLDKLKLESEMRLKNKVYAQLLKQEGYNVPKQFL